MKEKSVLIVCHNDTVFQLTLKVRELRSWEILLLVVKNSIYYIAVILFQAGSVMDYFIGFLFFILLFLNVNCLYVYKSER